MTRLFTLALLLCLSLPVASQQAAPVADQQITNLDQLLQSVRAQQQAHRERDKQRERQFLQDKKQQQALLAQARRDFEREQQQNQPLVAVTAANKVQLDRLREELQDVSREVGDLTSTFREFAGDFSAVLQQSMISAQFPERGEQLDLLASSGSQPTIEEIEALWLLLQEEMTEAGKVTVFDAPVVLADGSAAPGRVLRVGTFSAFNGDDFLRYVPETAELLVLSRQPAARYRNAAGEFANGAGRVAVITVDPTRGGLLGMLSYTPSLRERIEQGGSIALIILALGALGLMMSCWRR